MGNQTPNILTIATHRTQGESKVGELRKSKPLDT